MISLAALSAPVRAATLAADFEGLGEAFYGSSLTTGGITFANWRNEPGGAVNSLSVDDGADWWATQFPALGTYAQGKTLVSSVISPGPSPSFSLLNSLDITPTAGGTYTSASVNVIYQINLGVPGFEDYTGNTIGVRAFRNGVQVADVPVTVDTPLATRPGFNSTYGAKTLAVSGVAFDALQLYGAGTHQGGGALLTIDNVTLAPEPASAAVVLMLGSAAALGARRRRRQRCAGMTRPAQDVTPAPDCFRPQ
jgi:hypothetical protein